jgi:hypothetical protein
MLLVGINILQDGFGRWGGRTMDEIFGLSAEQTSIKDIEKLSRFDVMKLYYCGKEENRIRYSSQLTTKTKGIARNTKRNLARTLVLNK